MYGLTRFCLFLQAWDRKDENKVRKISLLDTLLGSFLEKRVGCRDSICFDSIALITVEPAGRPSFVCSCTQTRLMGHYKWK